MPGLDLAVNTFVEYSFLLQSGEKLHHAALKKGTEKLSETIRGISIRFMYSSFNPLNLVLSYLHI
ncbi:hypothetical protein EV07_0613 [Prochlorococcus sp. MIT 0603]|nr:hypothetical protein EV07_0613 [Prochlorococcus sp. MIT 0603]